MAKLAIDEIETDWYRWNNATQTWDFNHREKGWSRKHKPPTPKCCLQREKWKGVTWKKERLYGSKPTGCQVVIVGHNGWVLTK